MSSHLVLSFRFLAMWFHGRGDKSAPEWPPSPLRVFQALVAAAARAGTLPSSRTALAWLEKLPAPVIVAPQATESRIGYRLSVPHNAMDVAGAQWARGKEGKAAEHRAMKNVRPSRLPDDAAVHYAWPLSEGDTSQAGTLIAAARNVVALGWGTDLVVGDGAIDEGVLLTNLRASLKTWEPCGDGGIALRTPLQGTLEALDCRHEAFLARTSLADPTLRPPPPLSIFATTRYARTDERPGPAIATFSLMRLYEDRFRVFDTARRGMVVAGMLRHAACVAAENAGWSRARVSASIMGHGDGDEPRLLLVPVPSIEYRGDGERVTGVRRVLMFSSNSRVIDVSWAARSLGGAELVDEKTKEVMAVLAATPPSDRGFARYVREATTWTTVTPVVLPGHDDPGGLQERLRKVRNSEEQKQLLERLTRRREALVRKALRQAGLGDELALSARIETGGGGFIAGVEHASKYAVPQHLAHSPRLHVRLSWLLPVCGPLCIGSGRFSGLGLFVQIRQ
jgi:CRISPR-associated protein Csb2